MSRALIEVELKPFRLLSKAHASDYCGLPPKRFETLCPVPAVCLPDGKRAWDAKDLDAWIDQLKASGADTDADILNRLG